MTGVSTIMGGINYIVTVIRYRAPGMGYGHAKQALFELLMDHFAPARARRAELRRNPEIVGHVLNKGAAAARQKASATLSRARKAVGLD